MIEIYPESSASYTPMSLDTEPSVKKDQGRASLCRCPSMYTKPLDPRCKPENLSREREIYIYTYPSDIQVDQVGLFKSGAGSGIRTSSDRCGPSGRPGRPAVRDTWRPPASRCNARRCCEGRWSQVLFGVPQNGWIQIYGVICGVPNYEWISPKWFPNHRNSIEKCWCSLKVGDLSDTKDPIVYSMNGLPGAICWSVQLMQ